MGRPITTQKRGKASPRYTAPSHRYKTEAKYAQGERKGVVIDIKHDSSKTGTLMLVQWEGGEKSPYIAPEGVKVGDDIMQGGSQMGIGNVLSLMEIPEGIPIFNIEKKPGDGGAVARASGAGAYIIGKKGENSMVRLPSKRIVQFNSKCRATIGVSAGGGRTEKPIIKAGNQMKKRRARGHLFPVVRGVAMNPIDHPHGGSQHHAGKATTVKRDTPPGRKVGHIAAKRTGRKKR